MSLAVDNPDNPDCPDDSDVGAAPAPVARKRPHPTGQPSPAVTVEPTAGPIVIETDTPLAKYWRPAVAIIYLVICVFDFLIMPQVVHWERRHYDKAQVVALARQFEEKDAQIHALDVLSNQDAEEWKPITLIEGGFFHIAFGAILGAASYTRGQEKVERLRRAT